MDKCHVQMREDLTKLRTFQQKHALVSNYSVNKDTSSARLKGWYIYMYYKYWYILTHTYWVKVDTSYARPIVNIHIQY